uniref:Uncharacterized protein n=1 Tax=Helianthus annuus TaxID=4232 RepID=A0A251VBD5_HELAN
MLFFINVNQIYGSRARCFLIGCCYEIVIKCNLHFDCGEFDVFGSESMVVVQLICRPRVSILKIEDANK